MEKHYVYIIQSELDNSLYKGYSTNTQKRLLQHNNGESSYTSKKILWKLVYVQVCKNKTQALKREKQLKRANADYINWVIYYSSLEEKLNACDHIIKKHVQ